MTRLADFLGARLEVSDETLIVLRLLGRSFMRPVDVVLQEGPEEALRLYLESQKDSRHAAEAASEPFVRTIGILLSLDKERAEADQPLSSILSSLSAERRGSLALSCIRVIDDADCAVPSDLLTQLAKQVIPAPTLSGPLLSAFWHLVSSDFATVAVPDESIPIARDIVFDETFMRGPVVAFARIRPYLFFGSVLPLIFEALRQPGDRKPIVDKLEPAVRAAIGAMYRPRQSRTHRDSHLRLLAAQLEVLVSAGKHKEVAEMVLRGAAAVTKTSSRVRATMPFHDFAILEAGFSRGKHRAYLNRASGRRLHDIIDRHVRVLQGSKPKNRAGLDPALATNLNPYSEGVYFLIWQDLLRRIGFTLEMQEHNWSDVIPNLGDDRISFAVWNDYDPKVLSTRPLSRKSLEVYQSNTHLFEYKGYPLVVRPALLENIVSTLNAAEAREVRSCLLRHRAIPFEKFEGCMQLKAALRSRKIAVVANSEIEEVAQLGLGEFRWEAMTSDDAVGCLVDGKIDAAFFGGVQSEYMWKRFPRAAVTITKVERKTPVYLLFNRDSFDKRNYSEIVPCLLQAWLQTVSIWNEAVSGNTEGGLLLRDWIMSLASRLNLGVAGTESGMRTPLLSWQMLSKLSDRHNAFGSPREVLLRESGGGGASERDQRHQSKFPWLHERTMSAGSQRMN